MSRDTENHGTESQGPLTNRRRYVQGLGAAASVALAGCTGGQIGGGGTIEYHILSSDDEVASREAHIAALEAFGEEEGYEFDITPEYVSMGVFLQKMNTYVGAGNVPDLVYGGGNVTAFSSEFENIKDIAEGNNVPDSALIEFPDIGVFLHPVAIEPNARWYREDIWEEAGVGEPAQNWSQHAEDMETIDQYLPDHQHPSYYQASDTPGSMQHLYHSYEIQLGINYIERTGPNLDDVRVNLHEYRSEAIQFLEFVRDMYEYSPDTEGHGWGELTTSYIEEVSMQTMYPGRLVNNMLDQNPDLLPHTKPAIPELPDGQNPEDDWKFQLPINGFAVPTDSAHSDLTKDFLRWWFGSEYYNEFMLAVSPHTVPINLDLLDEEPYASDENWQRINEEANYKEFLQEWVPKAGYPKVMGRTDPVSPYWNQIVYSSGIVPTMIQRVIFGESEAGPAVDDAVEELEAQTEQVVQQFAG